MPLPPPPCPPPDSFLCSGCKLDIPNSNRSCLPAWCSSCFDRELAERLKEFERRWSEIRSIQSNFSSLRALDACHECWEHGYSRAHVLKGWSSIGLKAGEPVCREKSSCNGVGSCFGKLFQRKIATMVAKKLTKCFRLLEATKGRLNQYVAALPNAVAWCSLPISFVQLVVRRMRHSAVFPRQWRWAPASRAIVARPPP